MRDPEAQRPPQTVNGPPNSSSTVNTGGFASALTPIFTCCYSQAASQSHGQVQETRCCCCFRPLDLSSLPFHPFECEVRVCPVVLAAAQYGLHPRYNSQTILCCYSTDRPRTERAHTHSLTRGARPHSRTHTLLVSQPESTGSIKRQSNKCQYDYKL